MWNEILGWVGVLLIALAYLLISVNKLKSSSKIYHLMNLLGAIGIGYNAFVKGANPSIGSNFIWGLIAVYGFIKALHKEGYKWNP